MNETIIEIIKWGVTTLIGLMGIFIGRAWEKKDNKISKDKETIYKLTELLPFDGSIAYLRTHDFGNPFEVNELNDLYNFMIYYENNPNFFFLEKKLEKDKLELYTSIKNASSELERNSFRIGNDPEQRINSIQRSEEIGETKFKSIMNRLNFLTDDVCFKYDELIKKSKRLL